MIPLARCLIETTPSRKRYRYPALSDWIGGGLIALLITVWSVCV